MRLTLRLVAILSGIVSINPAIADVTVYSGQHEAGTKAVAAAFTKATGIEVIVKRGSTEQFAANSLKKATNHLPMLFGRSRSLLC